MYHQTKKIVGHFEVVGAVPTGDLHSRFNTWLEWISQRQLQMGLEGFEFWDSLRLTLEVCPFA